MAALTIATAAYGQQPSPATPTRDADIVVQHRTDAAIARLVAIMTDAPHGAQLARWNGTICPRVLDLDDTHAALIENRIGAVARSIGVSVASRPCTPTIVIIASTDADALARAFVEQHPGLLSDPKYGIHHGSALTEIEAPRPVRWIDGSRTGSADGNRLSGDADDESVGATIAYNGGSRIHRQVRENMAASLVIVDTKRLDHITWGQLADYLALVTLARPRLDANEPDSITSIFKARDAGVRGPQSLTPTDLSVLKGLYNTDPALGPTAQRAQIAQQIERNGKR